MAEKLLLHSVRDLANWMEHLPHYLHDLQLTKILIPGSHNSANFRSDSAENADGFASCNFKQQQKKQHRSNGQPTQHLNFTQQLAIGMRYFDIRIEHVESKGLVLADCKHDLTVFEVLEEMNDFLDLHPKEVVILDMTAFYHLSEDHHEQLINNMSRIFGTKLQHMCPSEELTLNDLWNEEKQILVLYHDDKVASYRWDCFSGDNIEISDLRALKNLKNISSFKIKKRSYDLFHLTQWITTTRLLRKSAKFGTCAVLRVPSSVNDRFRAWFQKRKRNVCGLNIIAFDLISDDELIKFVVHENWRSIEIPQHLTYESMV